MLKGTSEKEYTLVLQELFKTTTAFNKLTDYQLKALMLGKVLTSPKLLSTNNYLLFPDEESENAAKTELMTPDYFY